MMAVGQVNVTFESEDYKSIGVYDFWENSPFTTGELKGNVAVVANDQLNTDDELYGFTPNASEHMLAFQRSRFGGNLYGARIDLNQTFELTTKTRYVHCLLWKPAAGRVMCIALGKRQERAGQSPMTPQCWALSTNTAIPGHWCDMVFPINGAGGIDIHSLVIVPDCESPHRLTEDFACYIDNVSVSYDSNPYVSNEFYPVNAGREATLSRNDRYSTSVTLAGSKDGSQTIALSQRNNKLLYQDCLTSQLTAHAGETLTPSFGFVGTWMSGYAYIDYGMDGRFDAQVNDNGTIPAGSDLVSYSFFEGKNSKGESVANGNTLAMPAFKLPADMAKGMYRIRFKVDWNSIDAGGSIASGNDIVSNGGVIADVRLNVHDDLCNVTANQLNGDVLTASGEKMENLKVPFGKPLTIRMAPAPGFSYSGIKVRHGHNLSGAQMKFGTPQWQETEFPVYLFRNDELTLPAEVLDGDVQIEGCFIQETGGNDETQEDYRLGFDSALENTDPNHVLTSATFTGTSSRVMKSTNTNVYCSYTSFAKFSVPVMPGGQMTSSISYADTLTQAYLYVDLNQDGQFKVRLNGDGTPAMDGELLGYSAYNGKNSLGQEVGEGVGYKAIPAITMPQMLPHGIYRARLVMAQNSIDPANGDAIIDFLINVYGASHKLEIVSPNGRVTASTATNGVPDRITPYNALALKFAPSLPSTNKAGYVQQRMKVRRGHNLDGPQYIHDNCQWWEYEVVARSSYTVPADTVQGDLRITAEWLPDGTQNLRKVFEDEFDGTSIDASAWVTPARQGAAWNRYISADPRVAYVEDGHLACRAIATPADLTDEKQPMITGAVQSDGKFGFQYGYIEVRAKTNPFTGNFPAIWMMPEDGTGGWPTCGEIDIWETINATSASYFTVHSNWTYNLGNTSNPASSGNTSGYVLDGMYHNYGLLWTANKLTWYVDGNVTFNYAKSTDQSALDKGQWPFDKKFYIILNQSVGNGSWASNPDLSHIYETDFDWVRVYQLAEDIERDGNIDVSVGAVDMDTKDTRLYDVSGRRVSKTSRGIYILGDKKVIF